MEPSLYAPPLCGRFLAGGPQQLRLSLTAIAGLLGGGVVLLVIQTATWLVGNPIDLATPLRATAAATLTAVLTAALAARWLGGRVGALAGLIYLTSRHVLLLTPAAASDIPLSAAVAAAMGAFALANVPGRLPLVDGRATRLAFYAATGISALLAGAVGPVMIFAGCLTFLALSEDPRGVRFLLAPPGIALFLLLIGVRLVWAAAWQGAAGQPQCFPGDVSWPRTLRPEVFASLAAAMRPWTPLALLTVVFGVRGGHDAAAVWRFFGCWTFAPLLLAALGVLGDEPPLGVLLPPLATIGAAGLCGVTCWCRRCGWTACLARRSNHDKPAFDPESSHQST